MAAIAGKEFDETIQSRVLLILGFVFIGALGLVTIGYRLIAPRPTSETLVVYQLELTQWLIPVAALVGGYDAIVGEREAGTLGLLFGFPFTRGEVLCGKLLGRFAAVAAPVLVGLLGSMVLAVFLYPSVDPGTFGMVLIASVLLVAVFVSIAVSVSAVSRSAVRVVVTVVGIFVLFLFLWDLVPAAVYFIINGSVLGSESPPAWYILLGWLNPIQSFYAFLTATLPMLSPPQSTAGRWFMSSWVAGGVLLSWIWLPVALSYAYFRSLDLT